MSRIAVTDVAIGMIFVFSIMLVLRFFTSSTIDVISPNSLSLRVFNESSFGINSGLSGSNVLSMGLFKLEVSGNMYKDDQGNIMLQPQGNVLISPIQANKDISNQINELSAVSSATNMINKQISIHPFKNLRRQDISSTDWTSPQPGTDILSNPLQLVQQFNQSRSLVPKLDLERDYTVYFCKHLGHGVRFFFLSREGLILHPRIHMTTDPSKAEFIVYLPVSSPWQKSECNRPEYRNRTIILDEGDGPGLFEIHDGVPGSWFLYFKRSFVSRHKGIFQGYMNYVNRGDIFPMTYTTAEAYIKLQYTNFIDRDIEILCTLRGSSHDPVRLRVREWIEEYVKARGIKNAIAGQINAASRTVISHEYFENMYRSKIIVTANPSGWEGDFRFCEALSSGSLIMIDHMYVPRPHAFLDNHHVVFYDNNNKTDIFEKLDYYRARRKEAAMVAMTGYLHAMKYHRAVNLIDYIFKTVHQKQVFKSHFPKLDPDLRSLNGIVDKSIGKSLHYQETGYDMLKLAQDKSKKYKLVK